jgi:transcriptional regulator with XRE-family HTH domain
MYKLKYFMGKNGDTQSDLASVLGIAQSALSARMNGRTDFRKNEIDEIRKRYRLSAEDVQDIFFAS